MRRAVDGADADLRERRTGVLLHGPFAARDQPEREQRNNATSSSNTLSLTVGVSGSGTLSDASATINPATESFQVGG